MKKPNKARLRAVICLLVLGTAAFRFRDWLWEGIREMAGISQTRKAWIFLASAGYMLTEGKIISRLGKRFHGNIRWRTGVCCAYYCSFARTVTFGGGGGAAEIYYLNREGIAPGHALDISLIRYLVQRTASACMGAASLVFLYPGIKDTVGSYMGCLVFGTTAAAAATLAMLLVLVSERTAGGVFRLLDWFCARQEKWKEQADKWKKQILLGQEGIKKGLQNPQGLTELFFWNLIKYFCWFSIPYLLYGDRDSLSLGVSVGLMATATVMASVIPAPGGYGSLEFVQILLFEPILGRGRAVSMAILYRVSTTMIPALIGGAAVLLRKRERRKLT